MGLLERANHVVREVLTSETLDVLPFIPVVDRCMFFFAAKSKILQFTIEYDVRYYDGSASMIKTGCTNLLVHFNVGEKTINLKDSGCQ
jgi:hypothetical protein